MNKKTIEDISVNDKKVLVRCDFNVPLDENGIITDNTRIVAALPTIKKLIEKKAKVILCSHLGRPKGEVNLKYSLKPVAEELSRLLNIEVKFSKDTIGEEAHELAESLKSGEALLLENLRFDAREEKNDDTFAKELAGLCDGIYVNDAFGTAHRAHASTEGVTHYVDVAVAGFLMQKEIEFLSSSLENPEKPFISILGGSKVSDKIGVIENLIEKVDEILIGGGMAFTFLKAEGYNIGKSICEEDKIEEAKNIMSKAESKGVKIVLPKDVKITTEFSNDTPERQAGISEIPNDYMGLDIGDNTCKEFAEELKKAKTILWNGPLGVCEFDKYCIGTEKVAEAIAENQNAISIVGGGDSVAAIKKLKLEDKFTHISTGGGASLELLEGKELPGLQCLTDK